MNRRKAGQLFRLITAVLSVAAGVIVVLAFLAPLCRVILGNLTHLGSSTASFSYILKVTFFTLKTALLSTFVAFVMGVVGAFFCGTRTFFCRQILLSFSAVPLCIPPLITALGYVSFFGMNGYFNQVIKTAFDLNRSPIRFLYSETGIIICQGFYNFPLVLSIVSRAWKNLDIQKENAARLLGAGSGRVFFTITLPILLPAMATACIPVFLFCFFSFMIVLLFSAPGTSTLEVEIFRAVRNTLDTGAATGFAITETFTALLVVFLYSLILQKNSSRIIDAVEKRSLFPGISKAPYQNNFCRFLELLVFIIFMLLIITFFVLPLIGIILYGFMKKQGTGFVWSFSHYTALFTNKNFIFALKNTLKMAPWTGFLCTVLGFSYSVAFPKKNVLSQSLPLLSMAVSSVVLGWGVISIFRSSSPVILVIMQTAIYWPVAYRQIQSRVDSISTDVINAGLLLGSGRLEVIFRIMIPLCLQSLFSAFCYCFALSCGDTTLPLMLSVRNFDTLSLYTYRLAGAYRFNQACACATVLGILCCTVFGLSGLKKIRHTH